MINATAKINLNRNPYLMMNTQQSKIIAKNTSDGNQATANQINFLPAGSDE